MEGIVFIGIQASGKTSFYQRFFFRSHVRLSLDMLKTRHREAILVDACIKAKQPFVIDNTNPTQAERVRYISKLREHGFKIKGYYFQSKIEECLARNILRQGRDQIPEVGVKGTYNKLQPPSYEEGFDELYYVALKGHEFVVQAWENEI
jgi:predicted kinase